VAKKFLFVCGCPRSGTSFLHRILTHHPAIAIGLERFNLRTFARKTTPADFTQERFFHVEPGDTWYDDLSRFDWLYRNLDPRYDAADYVGDKTPRAYEVFDHLIAQFPDVRFLVIVRDVFDVAASYENRRKATTEWNPEWNARKAVEHWNESLRCTLAAADLAPVLPIVYEDLVAGDGPLAAVADFLEVDPSPLREAWRLRSRKESPPPPGAAVAALEPEDAAFINAAADRDALDRVVQLARRPVPYAGAARTVQPPPRRITKYFASDAPAFVYPRSQPAGSRIELRNPPDAYETAGPYVACVGSAATFGRLVERPFCTLLEERLGLPVLNLGFGGARPDIFFEEESLARLIQGAACVVVEAMSARGYATDLFTSLHGYTNMGHATVGDGTDCVAAAPAVAEFVDTAYARPIRVKDADGLSAARMVCRAAYIRGMKRLADLAGDRGLLFYFSQRSPDFTPPPEPRSFAEWSGGFPHHIDRRVLDVLAPRFRAVVTVVSSAGSPETIRDRETGEPLPIFPDTPHPEQNTYYPSSLMHVAAADALEPAVRGIVDSAARAPRCGMERDGIVWP